MNSTVAQNAAHKNDIAWNKTAGKWFHVADESFISEYVNVFTGQAIRKSWRMTGRDWWVFSPEGEIVSKHHSLTFAKLAAANV